MCVDHLLLRFAKRVAVRSPRFLFQQSRSWIEGLGVFHHKCQNEQFRIESRDWILQIRVAVVFRFLASNITEQLDVGLLAVKVEQNSTQKPCCCTLSS